MIYTILKCWEYILEVFVSNSKNHPGSVCIINDIFNHLNFLLHCYLHLERVKIGYKLDSAPDFLFGMKKKGL